MLLMPHKFSAFAKDLNYLYCANFVIYAHAIKPVINQTNWVGLLDLKIVANQTYDNLFDTKLVNYTPIVWTNELNNYKSLMKNMDHMFLKDSKRKMTDLKHTTLKKTPSYLHQWGPSYFPMSLSSTGKLASLANIIYWNHKILFDSLQR